MRRPSQTGPDISARPRPIEALDSARPLSGNRRQTCFCNRIQLSSCIRSPVRSVLAIRLFLSACVALMALGIAWAEKGSSAQGPQPEIHYAPREDLESLDA